MKKKFVKYFGVASTTLLAVAPVATPALMTASNLAVVKAGVQDDISAAFKADNTMVQLTADQWKGLTSTVVNDKAESNSTQTPASQNYLNKLESAAVEAKNDTAKAVQNYIINNLDENDNIAGTASDHQPNREGKYSNTILISGLFSMTDITPRINIVYEGNGRNVGTIRNITGLNQVTFNQFYNAYTGNNVIDLDHGDHESDRQPIYNKIFNNSTVPTEGLTKYDIANMLSEHILKMPAWWFVSESNSRLVPSAGETGIFNAKSQIFKPKIGAPEDIISNGLVTVAPNGGVLPGDSGDYQSDDPSLAYVGDNLVDLQKHTNNELLNLIPSVNKGQNRSGKKFSSVQGQFKVPGGKIIADGMVADGSKVWSTILQSVLNPNNAMYPLKDLTTSNITKTKMLVNGKDADKNQFITKDEIQNADRISIQFIFKDNAGNEYKSPTIWLTHGNKYTVNTSGLSNITRLPGDYYQPSTGITGIINDTGLPMDSKKFVVVPAGTDLSYYTDKDGKVNLNDLASLQGGILGTNGVAVNRTSNVAFEGGKLDQTQYWTTPGYIYSKFGSYNDAVDIYYLEVNPEADTNNKQVISKTQAEYKAEAAGAVKARLNSEIAKFSDDKVTIPIKNIWDAAIDTLGNYIKNGNDARNELQGAMINWNLKFGTHPASSVFKRSDGSTDLVVGYLKNNNATYPAANPQNLQNYAFKGTVDNLFSYIVQNMDTSLFKQDVDDKAVAPGSKFNVPVNQLTKLVTNAGRTTKVDVPSKYLPQISFNNYKNATYYGNDATVDNWFNYSWKSSASAASSGNDPYYPAGGVIVTGGSSSASSSASSAEPISYLAPAAFAANSISADQFESRVTENIQKYMTAKLSNPNTKNDSYVNGYFNSYEGQVSGDAAFAYIKNGAVPASDLKIDTSKVDVTKPGTYYVEVTYAPLNSIKNNTFDGNLGATNGNVAITDANGNTFSKGLLTNTKFVDFGTDGATAASSTVSSGDTKSLTTFAADQIFANGAPATYKLKVQITAGSSVPEYGAPVIAFTEGGQNLKIPKGGTFDQFKGLQFYAYPGAKAWDQKDDSVKVSVSGKVNTNVEGTYTLVYTVTNKAGKTSTLTRVITVGSGVEKPTEYDFNLSEAYIDYVPGYNVREYSYPGNDWTGNQVKHGTAVKVTKRAVFQNGEEWYKLGDGNWVKSQYVKAGKNPSDAVDARGVVTVNYIPGYGIAVYKEAGKPELVKVNGKAKRLPHGTAWKSFKKQKVNGITYYNVGGNQWVDGRYVDFK